MGKIVTMTAEAFVEEDPERIHEIEEKEDHVMIDEIKGVHRDLRYVEEPVLVNHQL